MNKKPELVDLELPSRNLWMTKNLGASCETDYGNYYQWGSLKGYQGEEAKEHSFRKTCPFNDGQDDFDEEYFLKNRSSLVYKNNTLRPDYDVVTQTYSKDFKIPDIKDFKELLGNTISKVNTKKGGMLFTSKINENSIFIPFSGRAWYGGFYGMDSRCYLWLDRLDSDDLCCAWCFYCSNDDAKLYSSCGRVGGYAIRGIKVK